MVKNARDLGRLAATLLLAIALLFGARSPMQHQIADAHEALATEAMMPCDAMAEHAGNGSATSSQDHEQTTVDTCCGDALCAGYTIEIAASTLVLSQRTLTFMQSPPDTLHPAETTLPKRPPRVL